MSGIVNIADDDNWKRWRAKHVSCAHLPGCIPAEVSVCTGDTWQPLTAAFWGQLGHSVFTIQLHTEETLGDTLNG